MLNILYIMIILGEKIMKGKEYNILLHGSF